MNYELAKQLNDAGFPTTPSKIATLPELVTPVGYYIGDVYVPTLFELIEACSESILVLTIGKALTTVVHGTTGLVCEGKTPEEAVARLWLELNKKTDVPKLQS